MKLSISLVAFVVVSMLCVGCEDMTPAGVGLVRTDAAGALVSIREAPPIFSPLGSCIAIGFHSSFNVYVSAGRSSVALDQVTFRLLDGASVGGASLTFPRAGLNETFGNTIVNPRASRLFALNPTFGCAAYRPRYLRTDVTVIDDHGVTQSTTSTMSLE